MNIQKKKVELLERDLLKNKSELFATLLDLKEKEERDKHVCQCEHFCQIKHKFFNWSKPQSEDILTKSKLIFDKVHDHNLKEDCVQCENCD